jgi:hypothetical protein
LSSDISSTPSRPMPSGLPMRYVLTGGIENRLHWRLDVVMGEDDRRIRIGNAPAILSMTRHLSLNLFENVSAKLSLKKKRFKAALSDDFREEVVFGLKF